jgi:hypothetical protein
LFISIGVGINKVKKNQGLTWEEGGMLVMEHTHNNLMKLDSF